MLEERLNGKFNLAKSGRAGKESPGYKIAPLAQSLIGTIRGMDSAVKVRESLALAYWSRVVGAQAAAATEPETVRDGILFVRTKSSVWSHELTLHKTRLLQNLNRALGGKIITDIVFRAQGVTEAEEKAEQDGPSLQDIRAVVLEPPEKAELRARLEGLHDLEDDSIRQVIARCLVKEFQLRHWRLEHGWHVCRRCTGTHETEFALCPICRLCIGKR